MVFTDLRKSRETICRKLHLETEIAGESRVSGRSIETIADLTFLAEDGPMNNEEKETVGRQRK